MIYEGNLCMDVDIIKIKGDWAEVVDDCRATVKKDNLGKDPSNKFKKEIDDSMPEVKNLDFVKSKLNFKALALADLSILFL